MKTEDWKTEANVLAALGELGYTTEHLAIFDNLDLLRQKLESFAPDVIFNLADQFKNNRGFDQNIASLRIRNGRDRPVAFEVDVYAWRQRNGEDVHTPSNDVLIAPGVFEIGAESEQIVRLGVNAPAGQSERAYRIILRELPAQRAGGNVLGFTLELSLPVFVTRYV